MTVYHQLIELPKKVFCGLYPEFEVYTAGGAYLVTPKDDETLPVFVGDSLGAIAVQISQDRSLTHITRKELPGFIPDRVPE
jgi:hypothetical protein